MSFWRHLTRGLSVLVHRRRADNDVAVGGDTAESVRKLLDMLEDMDDVQNVYHNAELGEDAYK